MEKKSFGLFFLIIIFFAVFIGCSKNNSNTGFKDPVQLSEDDAFIELTTETFNFIVSMEKMVKEKSLTLSELQTSISLLQNENLSFDDQMTSLNTLFKGNISTRLLSHMKVYNINWKSIQLIYKPITAEILEKECAEVLATKLVDPKTLQSLTAMKAPVSGSGCGWRYYLCAGAATSGAIICHAGCDATALAATAGLGIPACVVLCGIIQVAGLTQCYDGFCK